MLHFRTKDSEKMNGRLIQHYSHMNTFINMECKLSEYTDSCATQVLLSGNVSSCFVGNTNILIVSVEYCN